MPVKSILTFLLFFFYLANLNSQTKPERLEIISKTNVEALERFAEQAETKFNAEKQKKNFISKIEKDYAIAEQRTLEKKYGVKRGERPPVELEKVPSDAYKQGVIEVKFKPYMDKYLDAQFLKSGEDDFVITGIKSLDEVNFKVKAQLYERKLDKLYNSKNPGKVLSYKERHQAWGFHLIRIIEFNSKTDVIEAVKLFSELDEVEYAEPVYKVRLIEPVTDEIPIRGNNNTNTVKPNAENSKLTPNDPSYNLQYGFPLINAPEAWDITMGNPNVLVAVIDQGIQWDHPDLAANMWSGIGPEGTGTTVGYHGTHVGGSVAAVSNNGIGVAGCAGGDGTANSGVKLMTCDMFNGIYGDDELQIYAADNDAMISQNSWGYTTVNTYNQSSLDAIDYFNTNGGGTALAGGITIFAAGNDNDNGNWWPACYSEVLAVASTDMTDTKSGFSNYGTWVDISAPGSDIYSTSGVNDPYIDDTYGYMSGTSMACPHVSGIASAIVSITEGLMTNTELRTLLLESVVDHYPNNPGYIGELGSGRIDFNMAAANGAVVAGALPGPDNFAATATGTTAIDVTWDLNTYSDDVLLAYAIEGDAFGAPVDGVTYSANDVLPGGGTVIYVGNNTSFSHTGLSPSTEYRYRVYSIATTGTADYDAGDYSHPCSTTEWTDCGTSSLPYAQNFNDGVPMICGTTVDHDGDGQNWYASMSDSPNSGGAAAFSNSWNSVALTPDNWLITPSLYVPGDQVDISFWVKPYSTWVAEKYSVYISTTGTNLPTTGTETGGDFTLLATGTLSSEAWVEVNIDVTAAMGDLTGENIYIAIRHWDCTDNERIIVDDLFINSSLPADPPSISTVSTTSGTAYKDGGKDITITGTFLTGATSVAVAGVTARIISNTATQIDIETTGGDYTGTNEIVVTTPGGSDTEALTFTYDTRNIIPVVGGTDPHTSIQAALDELLAWKGSNAFTSPITIEVYGGTYAEKITPNPDLATTADNPLIIQNRTGEAPVIDASGLTNGIYIGALDNVQVKGFTVSNANNDNVYSEGNNTKLEFIKSHGSKGGSGISVNGDNATVTNNLCYGNYSYGIHINGSSATVKNNTADDNGSLSGGGSGAQDVQLFFEDWESGTTGWTTGDWAQSTDLPNTGTYCAIVENADPAKDLIYNSTISTAGYQNIEISCYYRSSGRAFDGSEYLIGYYQADGGGWVQFFRQDGGQTSYVQALVAVPGTPSTVQIMFTGYNTGAGGPNKEYWHIDDILVKGDEPNVPGGAGLYVQSGTGTTVQNNIFVAKTGNDSYYALKSENTITVTSDYNTYYTTNTNLFDYNGTIGNTGPLGTNDLTGDPLFVGSGDYHVQSTLGTYTSAKAPIWPPDIASGGTWDDTYATDSPTLDAGNPADDYSLEPNGGGGAIDQGTFGNTPQATKGDGTLPVELITFKAKCDNNCIQLYWETASEINNDAFIIEKSMDAKEYKPIGKVEGSGNSNQLKEYTYMDDNTSTSTSYYRLKQIDFNGEYSYSEVISANCYKDIEIGENNTNVEFYPNPFKEELSLHIKNDKKKPFNVEIYNSLGDRIYEDIIYPSHTGAFVHSINTTQFIKGVYYIQVYNTNERFVKTIIKQ